MKSSLVYVIIVLLALGFGLFVMKSQSGAVNKTATNIKATMADRQKLLDQL